MLRTNHIAIQTSLCLALMVVSAATAGCSECPPDSAAPVATAGPSTPMAHLQMARRSAAMGRDADAWDHYRWCLERGRAVDPAFGGVWATQLPEEIAQLGARYPPALAALRALADSHEKSLSTASRDQSSAERQSENTTQFAAINEYLGEQDRTLRVFRELVQRGAATLDARKALWIVVVRQLHKERRYSEIVAQRELVSADLARWKQSASEPGPINDIDRRHYIDVAAMYYEANLGEGNQAAADAIAADLSSLSIDAADALDRAERRAAGAAPGADP